jgi:hypothetical protein
MITAKQLLYSDAGDQHESSWPQRKNGPEKKATHAAEFGIFDRSGKVGKFGTRAASKPAGTRGTWLI